jgi:hypothetical protein
MRSKAHTALIAPLVLHQTRIYKCAIKKFGFNCQMRNETFLIVIYHSSLVKGAMNAARVCNCAMVLKKRLNFFFFQWPKVDQVRNEYPPYTVKRVDEVVPHRHLVTQDQTTQVSNKFFHIHVKLIVCKCRTSSTEQESVKSSMRGGGREPTTYRTTICHSTTAPRFQFISGDEKKVIDSMSPSLSLSNFFDSENIG